MSPTFYNLVNKLVLTSLLIFVSPYIFASGEIFPVGARYAGMGRCSVALKGFWGIQNNPASISTLEKFSFGINYESRFSIKETSYKNAAVVRPLNFGVLGVSYSHYGYKLYSEQKIGIAYARKFGKIISIGLQLDYFSVRLGEGNSNSNMVTFEIGLQSEVIENLRIGIYTFNPIMVKLKKSSQDKLPTILRFGLAYDIHANFILTAEVEKNSYISPVLFRCGLEYSIKSRFFIRGGIASRYEVFSFGFGIYFKHIKIDMAATMHESLGFSPQMGLIFNL